MNWLDANGDAGAWPDAFYAEGLDLPDAFPPFEGDQTVDLCVVGGGITGLSAALHGAQAGMSVILLEGRRVGWGASGRNGGQIGSGLNWDQETLTDRLGEARARALWDVTEAAKDLTRRLISEHAPDAGYQPGILSAAITEQERSVWSEHAAWMNRHYGADYDILDRDGVAARVGTRAYAGGLLDFSAGSCNPLAYALGLARACVAAGVTICEGSEVIDLGGKIETARGNLRARFILQATNGYGAELSRRSAATLLPLNNYIAVTAPLPDPPMAAPVAVADSRSVVNYFRQTADGRLIYGGGESYGRHFPKDIRGKVRANLARVYPDLADVELTHAWGGTLAVTANRLPLVAETAPGRFIAGGYSGHGLALAGLVGQLIIEAIQGDRSRFDLLATLPVPALPGGRWLGGLATNAAMAAAALRDRLIYR
ncbi:MAG: FAD-dependent oxidoreductase [Pseudomonadota bacterium]